MKLFPLPLLLIVLVLAACAAYDPSGQVRPARGLGSAWVAFAVGLFGTLFPDIATTWTKQENRVVTRLMSSAILVVGSVLLLDYYNGPFAIPR